MSDPAGHPSPRPSGPRRGSVRTASLVAAVSVVVVVIDQLTKSMIRSSIRPGDVSDVIGPLDFVHVHNTGVAFGLLSGAGRMLVLLLVLGAFVVFALLARLPEHRPLVVAGIGLVGGGAVGNLIDRARLEHVTDFIRVPHWPAFNVADIGVTVGVALILIDQWRHVGREVEADEADG